ncbi:hypothetical protein LO739_24055 (plasmid) [Leclercia adecarboxylata]|uniref:hypothetical protein n=1 Tax=Leclercia adecarboxylata TaxID=83655 RepID=UPI001E33AE59|nr:hypothetical protein [Leclercia adecarboxylata]UFM72034.1 hypothetical protein LO739_24055 [Leclercia adecarboxylata]
MSDLCRCVAYGYVQPIWVSFFFRADPKKGKGGSLPAKRVTILPAAMSLVIQMEDPSASCKSSNAAYEIEVRQPTLSGQDYGKV